MDSREFVTYAKKYSVDYAIERILSNSKWSEQLSEDDQATFRDEIRECAELTFVSFLTLIDGVDCGSEGVFEIVAVDAKGNRMVLNPQNTEMLHNIFYDIRNN